MLGWGREASILAKAISQSLTRMIQRAKQGKPLDLRGFIHRRFWYLTAIPLAVMCIVMVNSVLLENHTIDEAVYLAAGYTYLSAGDYTFNIEHPPLGKLWVALPLLVLGPDLPSAPEGHHWDQYGYGTEFLYRNSVPADVLLAAGRMSNVALTILLGGRARASLPRRHCLRSFCSRSSRW